jgi:hypothetical protein
MKNYKMSPLDQRPILCVVVDVEEEFDWSGPFRQEGTVKSVEYLDVGHSLLTALGVKPAYLMTYPVAVSESACAIFRDYLARGACDIGAQLHPWVTPPHEGEVSTVNSYPSNLSADLERRKLECLIAAIEKNVGRRPRIYKAGRYGLDLDRARTLADLGFVVDTSVMPFASFTDVGGPDFFGLPDQPFWLTDDESLLAVPLTQAVVRPLARISSPGMLRSIFSQASCSLHVPGILARLNLLERLRLTPEGFTFEHCRALIDYNIAHGKTCFVLSFHSPSLMPGCTPFVRNAGELEKFLDVLRRTIEYLIARVGAQPTSLLELYERAKTRKALSKDAAPVPSHGVAL